MEIESSHQMHADSTSYASSRNEALSVICNEVRWSEDMKTSLTSLQQPGHLVPLPSNGVQRRSVQGIKFYWRIQIFWFPSEDWTIPLTFVSSKIFPNFQRRTWCMRHIPIRGKPAAKWWMSLYPAAFRALRQGKVVLVPGRLFARPAPLWVRLVVASPVQVPRTTATCAAAMAFTSPCGERCKQTGISARSIDSGCTSNIWQWLGGRWEMNSHSWNRYILVKYWQQFSKSSFCSGGLTSKFSMFS